MTLNLETTNDLVSRIRSASNPAKIFLFGSAARGEMNTQSDLDVLVVVREGVHRRKTRQALYRKMIGFEFPVDIVVVTEGDVTAYRDCKASVLEPALREGIELYAA
ncbi:MAG: nucleotidyltransferase domain-containing protein [Verrucomicrobia bacterium]|nr:nucleotidyltransferase domain-containing protein [Verrucomicrobiota bacterium]MCH8511497.1 nucleotidyltransferase domain-containing protein [Kiritimatiellia bacterium]